MGEVQEANMAIVRNVHEQVNDGNLAVFDEVLAPDYARHCQAMPPQAREIRGAEPLKAFVRENLAAFPDWHDNIDFMFAADDKVAYITTSTGTQTGQFGPFPPTGKRVKLVSIIIQRLENGKVAETWISWDNVSWMTELGHMPAPAAGDDPAGDT
jgi:predicted ester cyclase